MKSKFGYKDEQDKSYGLTGMAIAVVALDGEEWLAGISIDAPVGEGVEMSQDFYFNGNPRMSAKTVWNEMLRQYRLSSGMVISNVMCRNYVQHRRKLQPDTVKELRETVREWASERCSLDDDESDMLFDNTMQYFDRLYTYAHVHEAARGFADMLVARRTLTAQEIMEALRGLA